MSGELYRPVILALVEEIFGLRNIQLGAQVLATGFVIRAFIACTGAVLLPARRWSSLLQNCGTHNKSAGDSAVRYVVHLCQGTGIEAGKLVNCLDYHRTVESRKGFDRCGMPETDAFIVPEWMIGVGCARSCGLRPREGGCGWAR